jgi:membrane associated rhomboid family serine protease
VFTTLLGLTVLGALAFRVVTPDERQQLIDRYLNPVVGAINHLRVAEAPFRAMLRERTPRIIVTPTLAAVTAIVFGAMVLRAGPVSEAETLLAWGASSGSATTAGEWWRLVTAIVVHAGFFQLVVLTIGVMQVGALVERLAGPYAVGFVYLGAGSLGHAVAMSNDPVGVHAGSVAAVFGLYGVLLAAAAWGIVRRAGPVVPLATAILMGPGALLLIVSALFAGGLGAPSHIAGLAAGFVIGLTVTSAAGVRRSPFYYGALPTAAIAAAVIHVAVPVRAYIDVTRTLANVVALEQRTAQTYNDAVSRFTKNRVPVDTGKLTTVIEATIVPQLQEAAAQIAALETVLPEHQPLVASATEYLRLREESWRLRVEGLRKNNQRVLQRADVMAQAAIETLRPLKEA